MTAPSANPQHSTPIRRFRLNRFGETRSGLWVASGPADAGGRSPGRYRCGPEGSPLAELTLVRPAAGPAPAASGASTASRSAASQAIHLPGGRAGVLLFHGLAAAPANLKYIARGLHRAGFTVRVAAVPGYTRGFAASGATGHRDWADAALEQFDRLRAQCDTLAVGGISIGALLALHVAARRPDEVSHVLAMSTTLRFDGWAAPRRRWLLPLATLVRQAGRIPVKEREPYGVKDDRLRAWIAAQVRESHASGDSIPPMRIHDLLEARRMMHWVRQDLKAVKAPTLLIHARDDEMATPRSAFDVASGVSSERVNCVLLNDSYHLVAIDKEKARVLAEMRQFMESAPHEPAAAAASAEPTRNQASHRSPEHVRV